MTSPRILLLVRHGLPDYRFAKAGDEPPGPPLSALGLVQAQQAAVVLARFNAVTIHSSPLARAQQTAECVQNVLRIPLVVDSDLKEWHRTENLFSVSQRSARWLARWLSGDEPCAVGVGHASPLLAIIRSALYLPHAGWWKPGRPDELVIGTPDHFEVSMASVFALTFTPRHVTAECIFHPQPRIVHCRNGRVLRCLPRPVFGHGENSFVRRPNHCHLIGYRA